MGSPAAKEKGSRPENSHHSEEAEDQRVQAGAQDRGEIERKLGSHCPGVREGDLQVLGKLNKLDQKIQQPEGECAD